MEYRRIRVPEHGQAITRNEDFSLTVPDRPIIPLSGDDGIGIDLTQVTHTLMNALRAGRLRRAARHRSVGRDDAAA